MGKSLMTIATEMWIDETLVETKVSLADYLAYHDGTGTRYELVKGALKPMSLGTGLHGDLMEFMNDEFRDEIKRTQQPWTSKQAAVSVQSPRSGRWETCRIPDVVVLPIDQWNALRNQEAMITLDQKSPILVVEVVSPSTKTEDYRSKWIEYCALDILEYWIVDPIDACVTVCVLEEGSYTNYRFVGEEAIVSLVFPGLQLTGAQVLMLGRGSDGL
jgi:Uma2 family endonuclease